MNGKKGFQFIVSKSNILPCSLKIAKNSEFRKLELRKNNKSIGLVDAIIVETASQHGLMIVTGNSHFEKTDNVYFLKD
jgi:predicted nucleic acid-binding protein